VSAPHVVPTPSAVPLDARRLHRLAERLSTLGVGAPGSARLGGPSGDTSPDRLHRVEALYQTGATARSREAHRLVMALGPDHRAAAMWLASSAPPAVGADHWPALVARALGPRELAIEADAAAEQVKVRKLELAVARKSGQGRMTVASARELNATGARLAAALERHGAAVVALDAWGRVQLAAVLAAVDALDEARRAAVLDAAE
jgi:hypothetical protein